MLKNRFVWFAVIVVGLTAGLVAPAIIEFLRVDACLDRGGVYDYELSKCSFDVAHLAVGASSKTAQLPLQVCAILGWVGIGVGFIGRSGTRFSRTGRAWSSLVGLAIQGVALGLAWGLRRPEDSPSFSGSPSLDWGLIPIAVVLTVFADWLCFRAIRELGKQWSLEARVLDDHRLVTAGPYAIVRNPIYTSLYALMIVTALAFSTLPSLLAAIIVYWVGTRLRVRSEEGLLRAKFGAEYDAYASAVPRVVPRLWPRWES